MQNLPNPIETYIKPIQTMQYVLKTNTQPMKTNVRAGNKYQPMFGVTNSQRIQKYNEMASATKESKLQRILTVMARFFSFSREESECATPRAPPALQNWGQISKIENN